MLLYMISAPAPPKPQFCCPCCPQATCCPALVSSARATSCAWVGTPSTLWTRWRWGSARWSTCSTSEGDGQDRAGRLFPVFADRFRSIWLGLGEAGAYMKSLLCPGLLHEYQLLAGIMSKGGVRQPLTCRLAAWTSALGVAPNCYVPMHCSHRGLQVPGAEPEAGGCASHPGAVWAVRAPPPAAHRQAVGGAEGARGVCRHLPGQRTHPAAG